MANISEYISKIKTAIYGKDVRGALADGLDAVNKETEAATALTQETEQRQTSLEKQFDDQIANMTLDDPSSAELVAARTNVNTGESYDTIGRRLDAEHADVTAQLAETSIKLNMLNGKKKSFDEKLAVQVHNRGVNDISDYSFIFDVGFKFIRDDFTWENIEKEKGVFDFTGFDTEVQNILDSGLGIIAELDFSNNLYTAEEMADAYINYVDEVTKHFAGKGFIWEIWNEPNLGIDFVDSEKKSDLAYNYMKLVVGACQRIRKNDPNSQIIAPALFAGSDYTNGFDNKYFYGEFLELCGQQGLFELIDAVSIHPYIINDKPEKIIDKYSFINGIIVKNTKRDLPIVVTEVGWSTADRSDETQVNGYPVTITEQMQSDYICRTLLINDMLGVPLTVIYNWRNKNLTYADPVKQKIENNFGLVYNGWITDKTLVKPVINALKELSAGLTGYRFIERIKTSSDVFVLKYCDNDSNVKYVYWSVDGNNSISINGTIVNATSTPQILHIVGEKYEPSQTQTINLQEINSVLQRFGIGEIGRYINKIDVDTITENGIYIVFNQDNMCDNLPTGMKSGYLVVIGNNNVYERNLQIAFDTTRKMIVWRDYDMTFKKWMSWSDTDWMPLTLLNGFSSNYATAMFKRKGRTVYFRGNVFKSSWTQDAWVTIAQLPEEYAAKNTPYGIASTQSSSGATVTLKMSGNLLQAQVSGGTDVHNVSLGGFSYYLDGWEALQNDPADPS